MLRSRLDPDTLAMLQHVPDLPHTQEAMKAKYHWWKASDKAKEYTKEDKIQVMCHSATERENYQRNGLDSSVPAPQVWGAFARAFVRAFVRARPHQTYTHPHPQRVGRGRGWRVGWQPASICEAAPPPRIWCTPRGLPWWLLLRLSNFDSEVISLHFCRG